MNILLKLPLHLFLGLVLFSAGPAVLGQQMEPVEEETVSGRELLAGCEENAAPGRPNQYCMEYVFGLIQTVLMLQQMENSGQQLFCINPQEVSLEKVTSDVTNWLRGARDRLDEDAYVLVSEALNKNYPCGKV